MPTLTFANNMDRKFMIVVKDKEDYFFLKYYLSYIELE